MIRYMNQLNETYPRIGPNGTVRSKHIFDMRKQEDRLHKLVQLSPCPLSQKFMGILTSISEKLRIEAQNSIRQREFKIVTHVKNNPKVLRLCQ